jgi:hypothetical protein
VDDGVDFDVRTITVQEIREQAEYPGLRLRMKATIGSWVGVAAWDISTGDPIVPQPEVIGIPRVLGGVIEILAYRPETTVAEKGVTILERGTTSTLGPIAPRVIGYGAIAQQKWAAWRRKEGLDDISEASLDSQMELVSSYLDPVFSNGE